MKTKNSSIIESGRLHTMKRLLSIMLCLFIVFAFTACRDSSNDDSVAGIEYYHYDTTDFNDKCDKLKNLIASDGAGGTANPDSGIGDTSDAGIGTGGTTEKVIELYDKLYGECVEMNTLYSVIYVKYSTNMANNYASKEQRYAYNIMIKSFDRFCGVCRSITESPYANTFKEHIGEEPFSKFSNYELMTQEEKKLVRREKKLVDEYYDTIEKTEAEGYTYNNKKWTLDDILSEDGDELAMTDYDGYLKIYDGIVKNSNKAAGPIYLELVKIRDKMADIAGFDSFADYADIHEYNRDYSAEELEVFHSDVKKISSDYYENYYAASMDDAENTVPEMSEGKLIRTLGKYSGKIDKIASDAFEVLHDEKLYDLGDAEYRQDGAFTTYIEKAKRPYISMTLDHMSDFPVLTHEFGHFIEYNEERQKSHIVNDKAVSNASSEAINILTDEENIDLAEIASNGYEGLMTHYYSDIFGKNKANSATNYIVEDLMGNVIEGCIFDEFQREVYANPDMTLDEVNQTFARIYSEYDEYADEDESYYWVYVNHTFEAPMYYISYAVSGIAALQIWNMSQENFDTAVDTWVDIIHEGTCNKGYIEVIEKCNLKLFTEDGAVEDICKPALKQTAPKEDFDFDL